MNCSQVSLLLLPKEPAWKVMIYRRSKLEIYCDILCSIARGNKSLTRMMRHSNVSWPVAKSSISELIGLGLILFETKGYSLTPSGFTLVGQYLSLKEKLPGFGEETNNLKGLQSFLSVREVDGNAIVVQIPDHWTWRVFPIFESRTLKSVEFQWKVWPWRYSKG